MANTKNSKAAKIRQQIITWLQDPGLFINKISNEKREV